ARRRWGGWPAGAIPPARGAVRTSSRSGSPRCPIPTGAAPAPRAVTPREAAAAAAEEAATGPSERIEPMTTPASGVITITTDFGHQGPFVGVMKGCMLARFPAARIIDLTHEIVVHWPAEAGFWLARAFGYFPAGTVHVAVVDPGVGTSRSIVAVRAWVEDPAVEPRSVTGVVISIDHFGNLITNIDAALIERFRLPLVHAGNHSFPLLRTYGDSRPGEYLALVNSFGVVEIARAENSAAEGLGLSRGAPVVVRDRTDQP